MNKKYMIRIIRTELRNFKNVNYGEINYMNYNDVEECGEIQQPDIVGIYGQNGSGKTAMVEALDIIRYVLGGMEINFEEYEGLISENTMTSLTIYFFFECSEVKYKIKYEVKLKKDTVSRQIQIYSEKLEYWNWDGNWKDKESILLKNPFYDIRVILGNNSKEVVDNKEHFGKSLLLYKIERLAIVCAQKNISLFFNEMLLMDTDKNRYGYRDQTLSKIITGLYKFAKFYLQVVKVKQLGTINTNLFIPINLHNEVENNISQGCLPMFINGECTVSIKVFEQLKVAIDAINVVLKSLIPNLSIELIKMNEEINEKGTKLVTINVNSVHNGKRFSIKYESEGIKRIISLLNYLIALYNYPEICLVVDELDSGIFEYLLGELLGELYSEAKGQLIFTSHNLRILERLKSDNIICSTTNADNRYIRLEGISADVNIRDFYIRSLVLGGQRENLYGDADLPSMGFRKANNNNEKETAKEVFSGDFLEFLKNYGG